MTLWRKRGQIAGGASGPRSEISSASSSSRSSSAESPTQTSVSESDKDESSEEAAVVVTSDDDGCAADKLKLKQLARTAKARAAAIVSKTQRKMMKLKPPEHPAADFQEDLQPDAPINLPGQFGTFARQRRLRLLVSWLKSWCAAITRFFQMSTAEHHISHVLVCSITDDTNMRLGAATGRQFWRPSRVVSVMNQVQNVVARVHCIGNEKPADNGVELEEYYKTFQVHTPLVCLPKANATTITAEFASRIFLFLGSVSDRFQQLGMDKDLACKVNIQGLALCFDSLPTNLAMLKKFRAAVCQKHLSQGCKWHKQIFPLLAFCCSIHQLALARKVLIHGFPGVWSSIVRLAHLFEVHSFRIQFRSAVLQVIASNFSYVVCSQLPQEGRCWRDRRLRACNLVTGDAAYSKQRQQLHHQLMR